MTIKYEHLLGREFIWGKQDCYTLVREFYKDNFNILLKNYARPTDFWRANLNLYYDNFYKEGFRLVHDPISQMRIGDVMLVSLDSNLPNHAAVYVGKGKIIHHYYNQLSIEEGIRRAYHDKCMAIVRHKDVNPADVEEESVNLLDLLPPQTREKMKDVLISTTPE